MLLESRKQSPSSFNLVCTHLNTWLTHRLLNSSAFFGQLLITIAGIKKSNTKLEMEGNGQHRASLKAWTPRWKDKVISSSRTRFLFLFVGLSVLWRICNWGSIYRSLCQNRVVGPLKIVLVARELHLGFKAIGRGHFALGSIWLQLGWMCWWCRIVFQGCVPWRP